MLPCAGDVAYGIGGDAVGFAVVDFNFADAFGCCFGFASQRLVAAADGYECAVHAVAHSVGALVDVGFYDFQKLLKAGVIYWRSTGMLVSGLLAASASRSFLLACLA